MSGTDRPQTAAFSFLRIVTHANPLALNAPVESLDNTSEVHSSVRPAYTTAARAPSSSDRRSLRVVRCFIVALEVVAKHESKKPQKSGERGSHGRH